MKKQIKIYKLYENGQINSDPKEIQEIFDVGAKINNLKL